MHSLRLILFTWTKQKVMTVKDLGCIFNNWIVNLLHRSSCRCKLFHCRISFVASLLIKYFGWCSIGSILGCRAEILQLDVTDVKMDIFNWCTCFMVLRIYAYYPSKSLIKYHFHVVKILFGGSLGMSSSSSGSWNSILPSQNGFHRSRIQHFPPNISF